MVSWMSDMALASSPALPSSSLCLAAAFPGGDVVLRRAAQLQIARCLPGAGLF